MKKQPNPAIVVLGAKGMLGRAVFNYFKNKYPKTVWGTYRKNFKNEKRIISFEVKDNLVDFQKIIKKVRKIDYVINCIGILKNYRSTNNLIFVNSIFPHTLEQYAKKYKFKLIHVSSDAVFSKLSGKITEKSTPSPEDMYGASKMMGETTSQRAITIRTAILGLGSPKYHGLLQWTKKDPYANIKGYANKTWSGCTTFQFAMLCDWIISQKKFSKIRQGYKLLHFAPLKSTRYEIVKEYLSLTNKKHRLIKTNSEEITRYLTSEYFDIKLLRRYTMSMRKALKNLINFENEITKK